MKNIENKIERKFVPIDLRRDAPILRLDNNLLKYSRLLNEDDKQNVKSVYSYLTKKNLQVYLCGHMITDTLERFQFVLEDYPINLMGVGVEMNIQNCAEELVNASNLVSYQELFKTRYSENKNLPFNIKDKKIEIIASCKVEARESGFTINVKSKEQGENLRKELKLLLLSIKQFKEYCRN